MHEFTHTMATAVEDALKRLLSEKHLYQYVEPDLSFVPIVAKAVHRKIPSLSSAQLIHAGFEPTTEKKIAQRGIAVAAQVWTPFIHFEQGKPEMIPVTGSVTSPVQFKLPTINTFCDACQDRWPFNPVAEGSLCIPGKSQAEWFYLSYQCQQCKGTPIRFLVRRDGMKLRLAGRDPLEVLAAPKVLPKVVSKYYGDAQIAHHAGQTLAGLFLLRVFIEQFWRTLPVVQELLKQDPRATGEKQGDAYQGTLPQDFKDHFPSLKEVYGKLSAAIHAADANSESFDASCEAVVEHFDARRLRKIQ